MYCKSIGIEAPITFVLGGGEGGCRVEHLARKNHNKTEKWIINFCIIYRIPKIQEKLNTLYPNFDQKIPYT